MMGSCPLKAKQTNDTNFNTKNHRKMATTYDYLKLSLDATLEEDIFDKMSDPENFRNLLDLSFSYLSYLNDPAVIADDGYGLKIVTILFKLVASSSESNNTLVFRNYLLDALNNPLLKYNFHEILCRMFHYCYIESVEFLKKKNSTIIDKKFKLMAYSSSITWFYSEISTQFQKKFHESGGSVILLKYLNNEAFVKRCLELDQFKPKGIWILKSMIHVVHNLTKIAADGSMKKDWEEIGANEKLTKFTRLTPNITELTLPAYMALANILNEKEIEALESNNIEMLTSVLKYLELGTRSILTGENLNRIKIQNASSQSIIEAAIIFVDGFYAYNIIELLEALYKLCINDKMKFKMYHEMNLKMLLKTICLNGNEYEKEYATKLIWQLCFDHEVMHEVGNDKELLEFFQKSDHLLDQREMLKKNVHGILWMRDLVQHKKLNMLENHGDRTRKTRSSNQKSSPLFLPPISLKTTDKKDNAQQHIMISYNSASRDLCLKIKKELEAQGEKVWIDVEDISGSSLESMANAIERSKCVLICKSKI